MKPDQPVRNESLGRLDATQIHGIYKSYVDGIERRDLDRLSSLYHPQALVIANKDLARLTQSPSVKGNGKPAAFFESYFNAGFGTESPWEYVQGTNAFLVRSRAKLNGGEKDMFGYFVIRDGKIWRHISAVEEERTRSLSAQVDPTKMHPLFGKLSKGLIAGNPDAMLEYYAPTAVALFAASKSWGFRVRGVAEGRDEIRAFLTAYMKEGQPQVAELKDYVESNDTVYMQGMMSRNGVVSDSYGAYIIENDRIVVGFSTT